MNLKNILKQLKSYESSISTVLGFVVIVIIGLLVVNYFRNLENGGQIDRQADSNATTSSQIHTIAEGESLWTIAEQYYNDGFLWTEIMEANNITNPGDIEVGQELTIPDIESENVVADTSQEDTQEDKTATPEATVIAEETTQPEPTEVAEATISPDMAGDVDEKPSEPTDEGTYTVVRGDNLWDIAVEMYGDGYRWTDIAEANDLANPGIIHAGNVLVIPA